MAFDYDPTNATDKDFIRFKLDDVVESDISIPDETIEAELTRTGSLRLALLSCGEALYVKLLKKANRQEIGSQKRQFGERARDLRNLLDKWADSGVPGLVESLPPTISAGEISTPDLTTFESLIGGGILGT